MATIDLQAAHEEFNNLKRQSSDRNNEYFLLRQAVKGNFQWPRDWPNYIPKVKHNLCKPITERFATYLMGNGFSWNLDRPNTVDMREQAERAEKVLQKLFDLADADLQFELGAKTGSQLGRTIYKVYRSGKQGAEHACFSYCQPDYFYGVQSGEDSTDYSVVYYSYPLDKLEAVRRFGPGDYKTEREVERDRQYDAVADRPTDYRVQETRNVPVLEIWQNDTYALEVGGVVKYNGVNPNKWSDTGEGFIPFVVIENVRNAGAGVGEADIQQARELNELLNWTISRKYYIVGRWLQPTLVWEGAPQNYAEILTQTLGGGGAIPARLGSKLYFLTYDKPNPAVVEIEQSLRQAILETAGMNEIAMQGTVQGSINTGPSLQAQFQPVLSTVGKKRTEWTTGLEKLCAMLLQKQEDIGASKALGEAVINQTVKSRDQADGELVPLSGDDIKGLRRVRITWPSVLPADEAQMTQTEMQKAEKGFQSIYTTLEKLGEEYPDDEIARIRQENQDPTLRGQVVAEQMRSQAPMVRANAQAAQTLHQMQMDQQAPPEQSDQGETEPAAGAPTDLSSRIRELARRAQPSLDAENGTIQNYDAAAGY